MLFARRLDMLVASQHTSKHDVSGNVIHKKILVVKNETKQGTQG